MGTKERNLQNKPPFPDLLDTNSRGVWAGWYNVGDKEVAREAVTKGTHINLAVKFLSARTGLGNDEARKLFNDEVHSWVLHLLMRNQVFKATHILKNISVDPTVEMLSIFLETGCRELRDNIGNHLSKLGRVDEVLGKSWSLLRNIEGQPDVLHSLQEKHISINVRLVMGQDHEWKTQLGTDLFFRTFDFSLESFVDSELAWRLLLRSNTNLLKQWISVYFGRTITLEICENNIDMQTIDRLSVLFSNLVITQGMIDSVSSGELDVDGRTQNMTLNELSRYGVFDSADSSDLIRVIRRLLETNNLENVNQVITNKCTTVSLMRFYELLIKYCLENGFYSVVNLCTKDLIFSSDFLEQVNSLWLNVIVDVRRFNRDFTNKEVLRDNLFEVAELLSLQDSDLGQYFSRSPLVLLALVLFTQDTSVYKVLSNQASVRIKDFEINESVLRKCIKDLPAFTLLCNKAQRNCPSIYDLLEKHSGLKAAFHFDPEHIPHFNSEEFVRKYGCDKRVNFLYFIKEARPSYACKKFAALNPLESDVAVTKVTKTAIHNFLSSDITHSCIAFLEMAGLSSDNLRIHLGTANIIYKSGLLGLKEIRGFLMSAPINYQQIYSYLETAVMQGINLNATSDYVEELIEVLKNCDLAVKFASIHKLSLPELFLKYCAERNLWLPFLIYVQVYKYPVSLCCRLVQSFASQSLVEHLSHCLSMELVPDEPRSQLMGERDSRKYFLSRIGVRKSLDGGASASEMSLTSHSSYGSMSSSSSGDFLESDTLDYKMDLLQVLIRCHNSTDPPKALLHAARYYKSPFLAVLATSYEPDSLVTNWATWLAVSCDIEELSWSYDGVTLTSDAALKLLKCVLEKTFLKTLQNSFDIFLPDNPLKLIVEFLCDCASLNYDHVSTIEKLGQFHKQLKYSRSNSFVIEAAANDMLYFTNKLWVQNTGMFLIALTLEHMFKSRHDQIWFLDTINRIHLIDYFFIESPSFDVLLNVLQYASDNNCDINLDLSVIHDRNKFANEVRHCINALVQKKLYTKALGIAEILKVPPDEIVCQQMKDQFSSATDQQESWWLNCDEVLCEMRVAPSTAVTFYLECADRMDFNLAKYEVLKLAYRWARRHKLTNLIEVEKIMWLAYFHLDDCFKKFEPASTDKGVILYSEVLKELEDVKVSNVALSEAEVKYWEKTVEDLLDFGDLYTVLRLEKIFGCRNTDLEILKLCLSLVESILLPHQLSTEQRLLLTKRANVRNVSTRRRTYMSRMSSISSVTQSPNTSSFYLHITDNIVTPVHDTLALLEILIENLKNGGQIALKLLMTYRISINIQKKYQEVLKSQRPIEMVQEALLNDCDNKLQVVSDFVFVYNLSKEEVADFICDEIIKASMEYSKSKIDICFLWDMNVDSDFNLVLQLFPDNCTILGLKLYSHASSLYKAQSEAEFNLNILVLVIELLIRSHDCFTADCNMEGISIVLKKCQVIISQLISSQNWKLIVRLLTGIARYSEMNYVFQILRVNGQFELLLRKGSRKDAGLKLALLEYLKKFCPDDLELYKIVALHFFLFSEIALLWEQEVETIVQRMITLAKLDMQNDKLYLDNEAFVLLRNNDDTKRLLHKIMSNYKHAAEYHLYGEKLTQAMNAAKQAELLALQLSLLKDLSSNATSKCLLNLSNTQIATLITSELSFPQASILVDAYNYQVDWALVLFERYLVKDNLVYLSNFLSAFPLTEALVHDISRKFLSTKSISAALVKNMKCILNKLSSVHAKYRIASELGFSDIVEDLLDGHQMAYLKDTVWKKGYKSCKD